MTDVTYNEAVQRNFEDLIEQHKHGEIDWRGLSSHQVADHLARWAATSQGTRYITEAFWCYYEWCNG